MVSGPRFVWNKKEMNGGKAIDIAHNLIEKISFHLRLKMALIDQ
jgi:hypothetical protein